MQVLGRLFNCINALLGLNTLKSLLRFWGFMLVLLPCITLMLIFTYYELQNTKRESAENLEQMITMQQDTIDKWFHERAAVIRDMANWPVLKPKQRILSLSTQESGSSCKVRMNFLLSFM